MVNILLELLVSFCLLVESGNAPSEDKRNENYENWGDNVVGIRMGNKCSTNPAQLTARVKSDIPVARVE